MAMVNRENEKLVPKVCSKCSQVIIKLPDGKYWCGCKVEKDVNEEDPDPDLGYDIREFV